MKNSRIIMSVTALIAAGVAVWVISFPVMVHKDAIKSELQSAFTSATGLNLQVQGDVAFKLLPTPHLSIDDLYVSNSPSARASFLLTIKRLDIWPVFTSLFQSKIAIKSVETSDVDLELETMPNGRMNWQDVSSYWQEGATQPKRTLDSDFVINLQITRGRIGYTDSVHNISQEVEDINASCNVNEVNKKADGNIRLSYMGKPFTASTTITGGIAQLLSPASASVKINIISDQDHLTYDGKAGYKDNHAIMTGNLQLALTDFAYWVKLYRGDNLETEADYRKLPLHATADIAGDADNKGLAANIVLDGPTIQGKIKADMDLPGRQFDIKADIDKLNMDDVVENGFMTNLTAAPPANHPLYPSSTQKAPLGFDITSSIKIADTLYNNKHISNTIISADIQNDSVTIPQVLANLPGQTRVNFSGIGRTGDEGLTIEGQADIEGDNFVEALSLFKSTGFALPVEDFKRFHIRTNALLSSKEARLSELQARIENISASGDLIAKYGPRTSIRTALLIGGLNLDHIFSLWGLEDWQNSLLNYNKTRVNSDGVISVWLKRLGYDVLISTSLDNYTFNRKLYNHGNFNLSATIGKMQLDGTKVSYKDSVISGKVNIDVTRNIPELNLQADIDQFNPDTFFTNGTENSDSTKPVGTGRWSTDLFDLKWMDLVNGKFDFRFGHFKYKNINSDDVTMSGNVLDRKLTIESLKANLLGATILGKVTLTGGTIPTLNVVTDMGAIRIERFSSLMPFLGNMSGLCNANIRLSTNGVNQFSWLSNLEGSVGMRGRDLEIHGFNLPGIIRSVNYVRTVANILDVVKRAFPGGDTVFPLIEGEWSIAKGVIETSNTTVTNDQADGHINSRMDLVNWTMNTNANFVLKALDKTNPPNMTIKIIGDINNPALDFDTSPLEQYVSNKTSEKMLQDYGAH